MVAEFQTPLLRVSRPVAACSRCRSAKIKCDGKLPSCTACERAGKQAECSSTNDQFARGKERSYVSTLETRIEKLERRIRETRQRKSSIFEDNDQEGPPNGDFGNVITPPPNSKAAKRREAQDIDDLVSDFGYLTVSATARDFYGFTSSMSYARLILSACAKDPLPPGFVTPLPPRHETITIIRHYFDNFFILYPLFEEASFYASVDAVYSSNSSSTASPFDHFCVRVVLAIAYAGRMEQRGDGSYMAAIGHISAALTNAEHVLRPGSIVSVQALLLLHEYAMIDPHHFDSWSLIGAASRAMVDLGLHQDPPKSTPMSKARLDLRRRVFYCVYAFDRSTSLIQSRAFSFSDDSANVTLPFGGYKTASRSTLHDDPSNFLFKSFGPALDLFKLRQIQSGWYTELFQSGRIPLSEPYPVIWRACQSMKQWFENLSPGTSPQVRSFFELNMLYSYVYVLAASPRVPIVAPFAQSLIFEYCIQYAQRMTHHANDRVKTAPLSFYDAMRVYMTGRQFIEVLQGNEDRLLSGNIPDPPHVPIDSAPPPPAPNTPRDFQTNLARSIACIKQLTDCLSLFGMRWGYMSWRDRFQHDAEATLASLNQRVWKRQDSSTNGSRPSWNLGNSNGNLISELSTAFQLQPIITPTYPPEFQQIPAYYQTQQNPSQWQAYESNSEILDSINGSRDSSITPGSRPY